MAKGIDQLMQAVHHLQNLVEQRRQERASVLDTAEGTVNLLLGYRIVDGPRAKG